MMKETKIYTASANVLQQFVTYVLLFQRKSQKAVLQKYVFELIFSTPISRDGEYKEEMVIISSNSAMEYISHLFNKSIKTRDKYEIAY